MIPIIDGHHHIWRQADLPWLIGPMQPRIFGPYEAIRRDYNIEEFRADLAGSGVVKSVYVQTNWAKERFGDEAAWVQRTAGGDGWPHAIVAYADFTVDDVRPQLDRLARYSLVRGARMQLHWHDNPLYRFAARPDLATDRVVQRNIARWANEVGVLTCKCSRRRRQARRISPEACPEVTFVLQHAGMLEDLTQPGRSEWRAGLVRLAACPNVVCKLSGLGTFLHRNNTAHIADIMRESVSIFGADRCLFGSNFPIEKLWTSYGALVDAYREAAGAFSEAQQRAMFHDTAARVYRNAN